MLNTARTALMSALMTAMLASLLQAMPSSGGAATAAVLGSTGASEARTLAP